MKTFRFFSMALLLFAFCQVQAQTQKGSVMIGGNVGFANSKYGDFSQTLISVSPLAGFFVIDKLAVGTSLMLNVFSGDGFEGTSIGAGPFARYYFTDGSNVRPFAQAGINFSSTKPKGGESLSSFGFDIGIGASFFLNDHVAIDGILGFNSTKDKGDTESTKTFGVAFGVQAFIGGGSDK